MQLKESARPGWGAGRARYGKAALGSSRYPYDSTGRVFYNCRGQAVGRLENGWLTKHVDTNTHQLRFPPAWCIDRHHLERLEALGAAGVRLIDEKGTEWRATTAAFERFGIPLERGHGRQVALPLAKWDVQTPGGSVQLNLFEGVG